MKAMTNMQLDEIVRLIDPTLAVKRQLKPSSLQVYEVEMEGNKHVLKIAKPQYRWGHKHIRNERDILQIAHNIPGITHLVRDYGCVNDNYAILKEYFEGESIHHCSNNRGIVLPCAMEMVRDIICRFHSLGFAELDAHPHNVIISPDGRGACIIDFGLYVTKSDNKEIFEEAKKRDNLRFEYLISLCKDEGLLQDGSGR